MRSAAVVGWAKAHPDRRFAPSGHRLCAVPTRYDARSVVRTRSLSSGRTSRGPVSFAHPTRRKTWMGRNSGLPELRIIRAPQVGYTRLAVTRPAMTNDRVIAMRVERGTMRGQRCAPVPPHLLRDAPRPPRFHKIPSHDTVVNQPLTMNRANFAWAGVVMHRVRPTRIHFGPRAPTPITK